MRKSLLFLLMFLLIAGCSNDQPISKETVMSSPIESPNKVTMPTETTKPSPVVSVAVQTPTPEPSIAPTSSPTPTSMSIPTPVPTSTLQIKKGNEIIIGTFMFSWPNPRHWGTAEVTKTGANKYHLYVSVLEGLSHHNGEIETDFNFDGTNIVFSKNEYKNVTLTFTENSLTIDYPDNGFGGAFAEPKGTFYLSNSGVEDAVFLAKLYDKIKLPDEYRHGFTDVLTYKVNETQQILLVRSRGSVDRTRIIEENLVVYDTLNQNFVHLGLVTNYDAQKLRKKLLDLRVEPDLIYELLHKDFADRFIEVQMQRFDHGDRTVLEPDKFKLTDEEAFYIVTGIENATSNHENHRNADDIGSIFSTEVDHADNQTVTIHIYELVRLSEEDIHTSTIDWLEVDRSTGIVTSMFNH